MSVARLRQNSNLRELSTFEREQQKCSVADLLSLNLANVKLWWVFVVFVSFCDHSRWWSMMLFWKEFNFICTHVFKFLQNTFLNVIYLIWWKWKIVSVRMKSFQFNHLLHPVESLILISWTHRTKSLSAWYYCMCVWIPTLCVRYRLYPYPHTNHCLSVRSADRSQVNQSRQTEEIRIG